MSGRCSPIEAVNIARRKFSPRAAARRLTDAVHGDNDEVPRCRLWCDGVVVESNFVGRLKVEAKFDDKEGHWTADIVSAVREAWDQPAYEEVTKKEIVEGVEVFGEIVFQEVVKTIETKPPYKFEFDVDEVAALLPVRRGKKGVNWEIHATLELERLGRKTALDLHNSGQLRDHLEKVLEREIKFVPKDDKALAKVIRDFLRGGRDFLPGGGLRRY